MMSQIDLKYIQENSFITSLNEKIAELLRTVSGNVEDIHWRSLETDGGWRARGGAAYDFSTSYGRFTCSS
jgi:hypothetical protein